ncbi:hypothetical protein [Halococcus sp. PRR34]|uniref:hypothetical protein n=1 Tax=Halococcus sp. PRR34 TaxID=3020830 RepID=UPI00235E2F9B|nr:hypothetical protein [Halococcus sp. PRR34]
MSDQSETMSGPGGPNTWSSTPVSVAYQEARTVLNAQQQRKQHLDDKALRTAQLATVVATATISLVGGLDVTIRPEFGIVGGILLMGGFGAAIASYTTSTLFLGPNEAYLSKLVLGGFVDKGVIDGRAEADSWETALTLVMGEWVSRNHQILAVGKRRLIVGESALFAGLVCLMTGVVL